MQITRAYSCQTAFGTISFDFVPEAFLIQNLKIKVQNDNAKLKMDKSKIINFVFFTVIFHFEICILIFLLPYMVVNLTTTSCSNLN